VEITVEQFVQAAGAVLEIEPQQLVPAIKIPLAESALAAPFATFGGEDFYPDPIVRAAILASRIMRNHPLPDGNKRVALILMDVYLQGQGLDFVAEAVEIDRIFRSVAASSLTEEDLTDWVRSRTRAEG
jgi:death-on-curing protein